MKGWQFFVGADEIPKCKGGSTGSFSQIAEVVLHVELLLPEWQEEYSGEMTTSSVSDSMASVWLGNWVV